MGIPPDPCGHAVGAAVAVVHQAGSVHRRRRGRAFGEPMTLVPLQNPPALVGEAFDSHCHLDLLDMPVGQVLADAREASISRVVTVGYDLDSSRWAAGCA